MNELISILKEVNKFNIISEEDSAFLNKNKKHLARVFESSWMWRTDVQKMSIISDDFQPTNHGKFHQAILEQKVQFDQAMYLAKDFELKKLEIEEKEFELKSSKNKFSKKRLKIEVSFLYYELKQMEIAMKYRMKEVKGWQKIIDQLIEKLKEEKMDESSIWNKESLDLQNFFLQSLTRLQGVKVTKDPSEMNNLVALAKSSVKMAKEAGIFSFALNACNADQIDSLRMLGELSCK